MLMTEIKDIVEAEIEEDKIDFATDFLADRMAEIEKYRNILDKVELCVVELEDEYEKLLAMSVDEVYARYVDDPSCPADLLKIIFE